MIPECRNCMAWDMETLAAWWRRMGYLERPLAAWERQRFCVREGLCQYCYKETGPANELSWSTYVPELDKIAQPGWS